MKRINYLIGAAALASAFSAYSAAAADISVTDAYFTQNGTEVHTLSNGELECVISASGAGADAVMINAVYQKDTGKLIGLSYSGAQNGEFRNTVNVTNASDTYVAMYIWDGIETANAKTQVYSIAAEDPAPENPWNVKVNNKGGVSFTWGVCEDNLKTAGYRVYKNGEKIGETGTTSFTDPAAKWYDALTAEYRLTAYDEFGNESEGVVLSDVTIDNSDIAAVLFSQPNITEKMSLYMATGKDSDPTWYGYNTAEMIDGVECRQIPPDRRAVFKLSDDFKSRIGEGGRDAVIRVSYYDNGEDSIRVSYVGTNGRYTDLTIKKNNTNQWITAEFNVSDYAASYYDPAAGTDRIQDETVDFTIWSKASSDTGAVIDTETYISELQIVLEGESVIVEPTDAPTLEPGQTPEPTPTATPEPTPVPTIDPADIKKASINFLQGQTTDSCSESENDLIHIFWAGKNNDGQINVESWYGYNYGTVINGEECRAIDDDRRLVLIYDEPLNEAIGSTPRNAVIRVKYLDAGTDKFRVCYIGKNNRYTTLDVVKEDSGEWKWCEFNVTDLVRESDQTNGNNGGYQDGKIADPDAKYPNGPNLTIWSRGSGESTSATEYISELEIILDDSTAEPTDAPAPTDVPTDTPTDIPTDTPTGTPTDAPVPTAQATEAPITSASIKLLAGDTAEESYDSEHVSIYWGSNNGQINNTNWYAYTTGETIDGEECRVIADGKRLVLMYDDALNAAIGSEARNAVIRVKYYDAGTDDIRVSYISKTQRYQNLAITKTDTRTWKWAEFKVSDLVNASDQAKDDNGNIYYTQDEQTYFSIWSRSGSENETNNTTDYISAVEIVLSDAEEPTEQPEDPTEPPADPTEPPADPTEPPAEPTEPPAEDVITSASIVFNDGSTAETSYTSEHMSVYWGKNNAQINNTGWFAYTTGEVIDGVACRKIENDAGKDNRRISLIFDDALNEAIGPEPRSAVIRVKYYDSGTDGIRVSYITKNERTKQVAIKKEGTNTWQWAEINVTDLVNVSDMLNSNGNGLQDEDTYFSIWAKSTVSGDDGSVPEYIAEIEIVLTGDESDPAAAE